MNLRISYNWLKEYLKTDKSAAEFAREFSLKSQTVDRVEKISPKFKKVITAKILEIRKHPDADKLKLVKLDAGQYKPIVVCGAPNIAVGQIAPLAIVGARVLNPTEAGKSFIVKKAKIRGVASNGMLCSQKELGLGDDHQGIMILDPKTPVGKPLEEMLPLGDYILDLEVTANRSDAMSVVGVAREAAAVLGVKFNFKIPQPKLDFEKAIPLMAEVKEPKLCPRYQAVAMTDVKVGPSPLWLQLRLINAGMRPINNLVDITNYLILEYGRPMHVFDYEKLRDHKIIVRQAKRGEKILALDGKTYPLKPEHLVIADGKTPVAIGGVMGGELSAASEKTKTIVFESAVFDPVWVRKTARELNLHSASSDLFEKGLPPESTFPGILRAIELTQKLAGGKVASPIIDVYARKYQPNKIKFDISSVKRYLGIEIDVAEIKKILESLGFEISGAKTLSVIVPWWRANDVTAEHDLIEEVARIYGYHNLPTELPPGEIPVQAKDPVFFWENLAKQSLAGLGFTEVYNYSMVSQELLQKAKFSAKFALKIFNPLNEEMAYLRATLFPQILQNVSANLKNFSSQKIFELNNIYLPQAPNDLPAEFSWLSGAVLDQDSANSFLAVKGIVESLLKKLGISRYQFLASDRQCPLWEKDYALDIYQGRPFGKTQGRQFGKTQGRQFLGQFGLVNQNILEKFDIKKPLAVFDLDFSQVVKLANKIKTYQPLPEFPGVSRDLAIVVDKKLSWQMVSDSVNHFDRLIVGVEYLSTFADPSLGANKKSLALRLVFRASDRTLKSEEVDEVMKKVVKKLENGFGAKAR